MKNKGKTQIEELAADNKINRKQAIKKAGFYAVTAAGMVTLLGSPKKSAAEGSTPATMPEW
jgi:hypothetical protein